MRRKIALITLATVVGLGLALLMSACSSAPVTGTNQNIAPAQTSNPNATPAFDHSSFNALLETYVNDGGLVDYAGLSRDRAKLDAYLSALGSANPQSFPNDDERLAFWINAYNAFTLRDVLDDVYQKFKGVREAVGFFDKKTHRVAGQDLTLDQIEANGRNLQDPRIHFAVVCASTSCPKLQRFAYTGPQLQEQLTRITREFLADEQRGMRLDRANNTIYLSSIFKWYAGDFAGSTGGASKVFERVKASVSGAAGLNYVKSHVASDVAQLIAEKSPSVDYLPYDWSLNAQETQPASQK